jgi:Alpha/beta hydrolase family
MTELNMTRRTIGSVVAGAGLAAAASDKVVGPTRAQSTLKTFVLIHGAWHGGWCWRRVSDLLEKKGHRVFSPTLTGVGERSHLLSKDINLDTHITDITNVIKWEDLKDICLVVHSYSGFPDSGAIEQMGDRVSSIVWLDAFKPENAQRLIDAIPHAIRSVVSADELRYHTVHARGAKPGVLRRKRRSFSSMKRIAYGSIRSSPRSQPAPSCR